MTQHCIMTRGLMCSGKTSWSTKFVQENQGYQRVCRDDIRHMTNTYVFTPRNEKRVQKIWEVTVRAILESGSNIVIDETNLNKSTFDKNVAFVKSIVQNLRVEIKEFDVALTDAIERDKRRSFSVGEKVIRNAYLKYLHPAKEQNPYQVRISSTLANAYIVDVDGTLARKHESRDVYDGSKAHLDYEIKPVVAVIRALFEAGFSIIVMSGRDERFRSVTQAWLTEAGILHNMLLMRADDDKRTDSIVKKELYNNNVKDKFNVIGVFDDRPQVLRMWQNELGLFTFVVNQDVDCLNDF